MIVGRFCGEKQIGRGVEVLVGHAGTAIGDYNFGKLQPRNGETTATLMVHGSLQMASQAFYRTASSAAFKRVGESWTMLPCSAGVRVTFVPSVTITASTPPRR